MKHDLINAEHITADEWQACVMSKRGDLRGHCSLEDLVAGAWEAQERLQCLADGADHPAGLQRGLATMSAVAQQRSRLQVHSDIQVLDTEASVYDLETCLCCLFALQL